MTFSLQILSDPRVAQHVRQRKYLKRNIFYRFLTGRYLTTIENLVRRTDAMTICDVGCGEGFVIMRLLHSFRGRVDGCDIDPLVLWLAGRLNSGCNLFHGDISALPIKDRSYDLVICTEVLEHLDSVNQALREARRIARRYCLFSVPQTPFYQLSNLLIGANWSRWGEDGDHRNRWTKEQFLSLLRPFFHVVETARSFPWLFVLTKVADR